MKPVTVLMIGAGGRCSIYGRLINNMNGAAKVVGVAEPRAFFRNRMVGEHAIPPERTFHSWSEVAKLPRLADAVIIGTQDHMHVKPAEAFANLGYHIMLEKPISPNVAGCHRIADAINRNGVIFSACHVMRYANYTDAIKQAVEAGKLGKILSIQHLEPTGHWRFAHSYVRGNWNRESKAAGVLLTKSIHDIDWLRYIIGSRCTAVSSFGELTFFRRENMPANAAARCLDCPLRGSCAYSAPAFYLGRLNAGRNDYYLEALTGAPTRESVLAALATSPYGRCVFACDNDVADHQVVNMEFANGATAAFSLMGCSKYTERRTTIFGTEGELTSDGETISIYDYRTGETENIAIQPDDGTIFTHHGGGDRKCLECFINAVATSDPSLVRSNITDSLETHLMTFAAERSRKTGGTIHFK